MTFFEDSLPVDILEWNMYLGGEEWQRQTLQVRLAMSNEGVVAM